MQGSIKVLTYSLDRLAGGDVLLLGVEGVQFHLCLVKPRLELDSQNDLHRSVCLCSCLDFAQHR